MGGKEKKPPVMAMHLSKIINAKFINAYEDLGAKMPRRVEVQHEREGKETEGKNNFSLSFYQI